MSRRTHQRRAEQKSLRASTGAAHGSLSADIDSASAISDDDPLATTMPVFVRRGLLGAATALLVARPLVPSDGGPWVGDGQGFIALWIVMAILWMLGNLGRRRFTVRAGWIDAVVLVWGVLWSISAISGAQIGAPRPSVNMLWEGIGTVIAFLLLRQLITRPREGRALLAVMVGLAVALSAMAMRQYFVTMPEQRKEFRAHPEQMFREAGVAMPPIGSNEFKQLEDRLNSPEPTATFTLTNSLAAFLAPWLLIALGIGIFGWAATKGETAEKLAAGSPLGQPPTAEQFSAEQTSRHKSPWERFGRWFALLACGLPIAGAMLLTRSRSAWIAAVVGIGLLVWLGRARARIAAADSLQNHRRRRWLPWVGAAAVVVAAGIGVAIARPAALEPAIRSLHFRWEYWRSTLRMISDHSGLGCGPGNFKEYYTRYKLPEASEEVSDPHNFVLEVAANVGLPALLLFLIVLYRFVRRTAALQLAVPTPREERPASDDGLLWILVGAVFGFLLALGWNLIYGFGAWLDQTSVGVVVAGAAIALQLAWIRRGELPPALTTVGVTVLLVALLAVGGITFAGVSGTLWLLIVVGLNGGGTLEKNKSKKPKSSYHNIPLAIGWLLFVALGVIAFCQHQTGYEPVLACQNAIDAARERINRQPPMSPEPEWIAAAQADPWAVEPTRLMAEARLEEWRDSGPAAYRDGKPLAPRKNGTVARRDAAKLRDFELYSASALGHDPLSSTLWSEAGSHLREVYEAERVPIYGRMAVNACNRAAELYPTSALLQFELAKTLQTVELMPEAKLAAREALRLDTITPHADKKLAVEQRRLAERIISGDNSVAPRSKSAEPAPAKPPPPAAQEKAQPLSPPVANR